MRYKYWKLSAMVEVLVFHLFCFSRDTDSIWLQAGCPISCTTTTQLITSVPRLLRCVQVCCLKWEIKSSQSKSWWLTYNEFRNVMVNLQPIVHDAIHATLQKNFHILLSYEQHQEPHSIKVVLTLMLKVIVCLLPIWHIRNHWQIPGHSACAVWCECCIRHCQLRHPLTAPIRFFGFSVNVPDWFTSFLQERCFMVAQGSTRSLLHLACLRAPFLASFFT